VTRGHALVVSRAHATDLLDITAEDLARDRLGADGVNLLNCSGVDAWQTVFHFHLHVIPRFKDQPGKDAIGLPWDSVPGNLDEIERIGNHLS
jgi:histidine triad (HIT) family protein